MAIFTSAAMPDHRIAPGVGAVGGPKNVSSLALLAVPISDKLPPGN